MKLKELLAIIDEIYQKFNSEEGLDLNYNAHFCKCLDVYEGGKQYKVAVFEFSGFIKENEFAIDKMGKVSDLRFYYKKDPSKKQFTFKNLAEVKTFNDNFSTDWTTKPFLNLKN